jgi:tetratricopeptide (TPR) repeat protein
MPLAGGADRPFVGRGAELEALGAQIAAAERGNARVMLISGEPGAGKTRLVEEAVASVATGRVLWGRCQEIEGAPPFWSWIQVLRAYVRSTPGERLRTELGDHTGELARLVPAIRTRCPDAAAPGDEMLNPEAARFQLFDAVTMFLRTIATPDLLVVVLDDLHWADSESLLLLAFVARELHDQRLLVLGTYRETELRQSRAGARAFGDLARASHCLTLTGLTASDVGEYVLAACGQTPGPESIRAILRATEGNAFFVTEVVELLHLRGQLDATALRSGHLDLPAEVHEVTRRRIAQLSDAGRGVLAAAAVLGREFEVALLARIVGLPADATFAELTDAARRGVIEEVAEHPGKFRFAHALLQETLTADLGAAARADLHRAVGAALEAVHGDALDPVLGDIAHHYFEAAPLGTLTKAIEFATRAAQQAYAQLGYEEAVRHLERAAQASRGAAVPPQVRLSILRQLGHAQRAAGDEEGARATFLTAAQIARDLGHTDLFAEAAVSAASGMETGTVDWTLVRLLEDAIGLVGSEDGHWRTILLAQLARALYFSDTTRRHAYSEEAVAIARRRDDNVGLLAALRARQYALWEPGRAEQRREIGTEIVELATATSDPMATGEALFWRIVDHFELGEMGVVHETLRRYRELAAACRLPRVRWHGTLLEATLALLAGRLADARRLAQQAASLLAPSPLNNVESYFLVQSFLICKEQGRLAELESAVTEAAERAAIVAVWPATLGLLHAELGHTDAAQQVLADIETRFGDLPRDGMLLGTCARLAEACALLEVPASAEPLLPLVAPHANAVVVLPSAVGCLGSVARYAGLLAHLLGRLDEAIAYFETALATNERIGALPLLAHSQRELARTLHARGARGDHERAAAVEAEAAATGERLGLVALQQRLATDTGAAPTQVAVPPEPPASARRIARLRHEGDVWTVACEGERTRLKDTKGVAQLLELLRHPGHEFHALDLGGAGDLRTGDAGEMLDADARRAYKARLVELRDELEEADEFHDIGRQARLREEMEVLAGELSRASGLGGRTRKAGSDAERARVNVSRAVRKVVRMIQAECPVLGRHLDRSVQTGLFCAYEPDPAFPVDWEL